MSGLSSRNILFKSSVKEYFFIVGMVLSLVRSLSPEKLASFKKARKTNKFNFEEHVSAETS